MDNELTSLSSKQKPNYEGFIRSIEEHCYCPICIKIAKNAVESECCGNIFCASCTKKLVSCPICRKENMKTHQSLLLRKIIKSIPIKCIYDCGYVNTVDSMETHYLNCLNRLFICKINNCNKNFKREEFVKHICKDHESFVISVAEKAEEFQLFQHQQIRAMSINGNAIKKNFNTAEDIVCHEMQLNNGKVSYVDEIVDIE